MAALNTSLYQRSTVLWCSNEPKYEIYGQRSFENCFEKFSILRQGFFKILQTLHKYIVV